MVKAGYSGSGLNDVIWMGDVVNSACHIANKAGRDYRDPIIVSSCLHGNLNNENRKYFKAIMIGYTTYYQCNVGDRAMNTWYRENCK